MATVANWKCIYSSYHDNSVLEKVASYVWARKHHSYMLTGVFRLTQEKQQKEK